MTNYKFKFVVFEKPEHVTNDILNLENTPSTRYISPTSSLTLQHYYVESFPAQCREVIINHIMRRTVATEEKRAKFSLKFYRRSKIRPQELEIFYRYNPDVEVLYIDKYTYLVGSNITSEYFSLLLFLFTRGLGYWENPDNIDSTIEKIKVNFMRLFSRDWHKYTNAAWTAFAYKLMMENRIQDFIIPARTNGVVTSFMKQTHAIKFDDSKRDPQVPLMKEMYEFLLKYQFNLDMVNTDNSPIYTFGSYQKFLTNPNFFIPRNYDVNNW